MPRGTADIFTNRRVNFVECKYWLVDKSDRTNKEELVHNKMHEGCFDAKFEAPIENNTTVIGQAFMFDSSSVSLSTEDDIEDIKKNCVVEFWGLIWRVDDVRKMPIRSNFQMSNEIRFKYYLELKR